MKKKILTSLAFATMMISFTPSVFAAGHSIHHIGTHKIIHVNGHSTKHFGTPHQKAFTRHYPAATKSYWTYHHAAAQRQSSSTPSKKLATSVLTRSIKRQLGKEIKYNHAGAFIINKNKSTLNARVNSAPYAQNSLDKQNRVFDGEALLNKTSRQYQNRNVTNNGANNWKPAGFIQRTNLRGRYTHAYDRGHLLGYALIGNIKGFDASEHNARNIATQTAWANEARDAKSTGQNYYEERVRKALDQNKTVRYSVKNLYENKTAKVPSGAWIQAKSKDGSINFNVFVPNVQPGLKINYQTGNTTKVK